MAVERMISPLSRDEWEEIEASHWHSTGLVRYQQDERMAFEFNAKTDPIKNELVRLYEKQEELKKQLKQYQDQYDEAKELVFAGREEQDTSWRAWFRRHDTQPFRQHITSQECERTTDIFLHTVLGPDSPDAGCHSVDHDKNGRIHQHVRAGSSAFAGQIGAELPAPGTTDSPTRESVEPPGETFAAPRQRHIVVNPGGCFTWDTEHKAVDGKQLVQSSLPTPRSNQMRLWDEHPTSSRETYHKPPGTHYSPTEIILTNLLQYLTATTPRLKPVQNAPPEVDRGHMKYFWFDVRQIVQWTSFLPAITSVFGGAKGSILNSSVLMSALPHPESSRDDPRTEEELYSIYTLWLLPRINAALQRSCDFPVQLSIPSGNGLWATQITEHIFVATMPEKTAYGGSSVRVVGLVKLSCRFRTSMHYSRHQTDQIAYLQGLSHLHHVMRQHSCRYGFILTETELVLARNGIETTPYFGLLEVTSYQFATNASNSIDLTGDDTDTREGQDGGSIQTAPCVALWGLCMLASLNSKDHPSEYATIGVPMDCTRTRTVGREPWMPRVTLREKREAQRARGWAFPEEPLSSMRRGKNLKRIRYPALAEHSTS